MGEKSRLEGTVFRIVPNMEVFSDPKILNVIGLSMDIVGVILLFAFPLEGGIITRAQAAQNKKHLMICRIGVIVMVTGFALQIRAALIS